MSMWSSAMLWRRTASASRQSIYTAAVAATRLGVLRNVSTLVPDRPPPPTDAPSKPPLPPPRFHVPRSRRTATDCIYELDPTYDRRIKRRRRIDPTRELNYTHEHWERHKSPYRRIKHVLTTLGSSPFQRLLFPDFLVTSLVAGGLTYYNEFVAAEEAARVWMDAGAAGGFAAGTTAIALLTGFHLNASYGRYQEGRRLLGTVTAASRDLANNALMWILSKDGRGRMLRLIKAYSVALTFHLNGKGAHHSLRRGDPLFDAQVRAEYRAEMAEIFRDERDVDLALVCDWHRRGENVPLGIASLMRRIIVENAEQKDALNRELDVQVQRLLGAMGGCERVRNTPIPTCFTRHASRLLFVWSNMMPFAIYPACGPLFTLPATVAVSYSIMGIEDIGVQLEEPFNILPLRQYSDGVYDGVDFITRAYGAGGRDGDGEDERA